VLFRVLAALTLVLAPAIGVTPVLAAAANPSGLPLPRFVTVKAKESNVRVGPGYQYNVAWTYQVPGVPVEIIQPHTASAGDAPGHVAWVGPGFPVKISACKAGWCSVVATDHPASGHPASYSGYLPETDLWGVYQGETFD
jgi:SH3-like domain-containing protein